MIDKISFDGKRILITGASGLIGKAVVKKLYGGEFGRPAKIIANVRNEERARRAFSYLPENFIEYVVGDIKELPLTDMGVDYIIHGANRTASKDFIEKPVEVIREAVDGTVRVLEFAVKNRVKGLVYLSSMEVYGAHDSDEEVYEDSPAYLDSRSPRSCYPESKRLCECLCASYFREYGVPSKILRLTQTFGEGVAYDDNRVFAEFARCAVEGRDIVLKTAGETKRNYLYTDDAAEAVLTVLLKGENGEAYNAANEDTYCSIYEMAQMVARNFGGGKTRVIIKCEPAERYGYAPTLKMNLSAEKLRGLGWNAKTGLETAFKKLVDDFRKIRK